MSPLAETGRPLQDIEELAPSYRWLTRQQMDLLLQAAQPDSSGLDFLQPKSGKTSADGLVALGLMRGKYMDSDLVESGQPRELVRAYVTLRGEELARFIERCVLGLG